MCGQQQSNGQYINVADRYSEVYKVGVSNKGASKWKYKVDISNKLAKEKHKLDISNKVASWENGSVLVYR